MKLWAETCGEANPRQSMRFGSVQSDTTGFISHRHDEFLVCSQAVPFCRLKVHADEQVIETAPHWPRKVGVLYGIEELGFIDVAAQSMRHTVVAQSAH